MLEFLGAERGLKRLALIPVSAAELEPGPAVDVVASTSGERRAVLDRERVDWVAVVVDGGRLRGWVAEADMRSTVANASARSTDAPVRRSAAAEADSLRQALDALVSSPDQVVIVVDDDDRYLGLLDVGRIGKGLETVEP